MRKRLGNKEDSFFIKIPLQKWAEPSEIADAVIYLSSDSAKINHRRKAYD
ncbi:MAG: hypothetical protein L6V93_22810 [Clostridiales bacterium]|nr:MAG: hypothetical protein L6V93_22810 [Clostridiales bacterium]